MSDTAGHTWTCSGCGRRVPQRAAVCHCGTSREQSLRAPARTASRAPHSGGLWRALPPDVKALSVAGALVMAAGLGWLALGPSVPDRTPPLLGYVERPISARRPAPPPAPPFKLPWWK